MDIERDRMKRKEARTPTNFKKSSWGNGTGEEKRRRKGKAQRNIGRMRENDPKKKRKRKRQKHEKDIKRVSLVCQACQLGRK